MSSDILYYVCTAPKSVITGRIIVLLKLDTGDVRTSFDTDEFGVISYIRFFATETGADSS